MVTDLSTAATICLFIREASKPKNLLSKHLRYCNRGTLGFSFRIAHFKIQIPSLEVSDSWEAEEIKKPGVVCGPELPTPLNEISNKRWAFLLPSHVSSFPRNCSQGTRGHHETSHRVCVYLTDF